MTIEQEIFKQSRINFDTLERYGFVATTRGWMYEQNFIRGAFRAVINIAKSGKITGTVYDNATGEEFLPMRVENMADGFIGRVKDEYEKILINVRKHCCVQNDFIGPQANRIAEQIIKKYSTRPEFPWEKYPGFGVFKHNDNKKWFALFMNIGMDKLGIKKSGDIDIMNIKLEPDVIKKLIKKRGFYPAYHMNKVSWITICLDDTLDDGTVMELVGTSYNLTNGNK